VSSGIQTAHCWHGLKLVADALVRQQAQYDVLFLSQVIAVAINSGLVEFPTGYDLAWQQGSVSIWQPIAPAGYAPIGCLFGVGNELPPLSAIACVHQKVSTSLTKRGSRAGQQPARLHPVHWHVCSCIPASSVMELLLFWQLPYRSLAARALSSSISRCAGAGEDRVRAVCEAPRPRRCKRRTVSPRCGTGPVVCWELSGDLRPRILRHGTAHQPATTCHLFMHVNDPVGNNTLLDVICL